MTYSIVTAIILVVVMVIAALRREETTPVIWILLCIGYAVLGYIAGAHHLP